MTGIDERRGTYLLDNAAEQTGDRFDGLAAVYDPVTFRHLAATGVGAGWHCLEVGAGGGSVARWLGERVGGGGRVLAVDLDTRWLAGVVGAPVEVRRLDVRSDELPEAAFDLVHARLVLVHLPERAAVLERLIGALKPGGWLVTSEFSTLVEPGPPPVAGLQAVLGKVNRAFGASLTERGADQGYGLRLGSVFRAAGLVDVRVEGHVEFAPGGSPFTRILKANIEQVRDVLVGSGAVSDDEVDRYLAAVDDPGVHHLAPVLCTARGRRPDG